MKRYFILLIMFFIISSTSFAFSDSGKYTWANDAVNKWSSKGYVSGYPDGTFRGNNNITRAEVISIINKINNLDITINKRAGRDINSTDWFFKDMGKATEAGLIELDDEGNLRPNDFATREEVMVILSKLLNISYSGNLDKAKVNNFIDKNEISSENYKRVTGIVEEGFISGYKDGTLKPKKNITRAEFISIINNAIKDVYSSGKYNNKKIDGNIVINGEDVKITNSEIKGRVFVLDGAKKSVPVLLNTRISKGINSRVGEILAKNTDEYETLTEYNDNNPEEKNELVFAKVKYSETDWTNNNVTATVTIDDKNFDPIDGSNKFVFDKNGEKEFEFYYKGKKIKVKAEVNNIDKKVPEITVTVQNNVTTAMVTIETDNDELSPLKEIRCSNGVVNKPNSETGEIDNTFIISDVGEYTVTVEDEAGNIITEKFSVTDLRGPDVTYKIEHYLQDEFGNYPTLPTRTADLIGEGKTKVLLSDIEKLNENGFVYTHGTLNDTPVTEITLAENIVVKLYYARQYTLTYDGNGGSDVPEAQNKLFNEEIKISDKIPVRAGYEFKFWSTDKTTTPDQYIAQDTFNINADTILYAIWKGVDINYKVEHYFQQYDGTYLATPSKEYIFGGENFEVKQINSIDKEVEPNQVFDYAEVEGQNVTEVTLADNLVIKLYYKYQYVVEYNANGGENPPVAQTKLFGEEITLNGDEPTWEYHVFLGWATDVAATSVEFNFGDTYNLDEDCVLYAVWKDVEYTYYAEHYFQDIDGSYRAIPQNRDEVTCKVNTEIKIDDIKSSSMSGYAIDYAEVLGNRISEFILTRDTVVRIYYKIEYTITYDTNGGDEPPESQKKYIGTPINIIDVIPTKNNCEFLGWNIDKEDVVPTYKSGDVFDENNNITLYAIWYDKNINKPILRTDKNMEAVNWDSSTNSWVRVDEADWDYNYKVASKYSESAGNDDYGVAGDGTARWANARTDDGSMWVWIPRFSYKIVSGEHQENVVSWTSDLYQEGDNKGKILIKFSNGLDDYDAPGFIPHPAFTFGEDVDGNPIEIKGFWVAKYEMSMEKNGADGYENVSVTDKTVGDIEIPNDGSIRMISKGGGVHWSCISGENAFNNCYNYNRDLDSHLIKNIEWGAIAYLTNGLGRIPYVNKTSSCGAGQQNGTKISTTHNRYGVYDMAGCGSEYVAAEIVLSSTTSPQTKYKDRYFVSDDFENYKDIKGDAIYEIHTASSGYTGWDGSCSSFSHNGSWRYFSRGGSFSTSESNQGIFTVSTTNYFTYDCEDRVGFRVTLIPEEII